MSQRLGRQAQDEFKLLCSRAGVTCNPSSEDDHGWDFLIEVESEKEVHMPADKQAGLREALVQVKSTYGKSSKARIKVSNGLKFSQTELPCFVVLFRYDTCGGSQIYVRHFWRDLIERALIRGRQASVENKEPHKAFMEIGFSEQDEHSNDLIDWIISTVRAGSDEYSAEKKSLFKSLGYENRNYRAEITFGPICGIQEIVDHELGLTDTLPVSKVRLVDSRFGIDAPDPILESEHARMQIRPSEQLNCSAVLQISNGDLISFEATMRMPRMLKVPSDRFKVVVESWCFVAVVSTREGLKVDVKDLWDEKFPVERLCELAKFLSWGGKEVSINFIRDDVPPLSLQGRFTCNGGEELFSEILNVAEMLKSLQIRAGFTGASYSLNDLRGCLRELATWNCILSAEDMKFGARDGVTTKADVAIHSILGYFEFKIGELHHFVLFDASVVDRSNEEEGMMLDCEERIVRDCYVGHDAEKISDAGKRSHQVEADYREDNCLDLGDLRALLGGREDVCAM